SGAAPAAATAAGSPRPLQLQPQLAGVARVVVGAVVGDLRQPFHLRAERATEGRIPLAPIVAAAVRTVIVPGHLPVERPAPAQLAARTQVTVLQPAGGDRVALVGPAVERMQRAQPCLQR